MLSQQEALVFLRDPRENNNFSIRGCIAKVLLGDYINWKSEIICRIDKLQCWHYLRQHDNVTVHQIIVQQKPISFPLRDVVLLLHLPHELPKYRQYLNTCARCKDSKMSCHSCVLCTSKCGIFFVYMGGFFNSKAYLPNWPKSKATYIKTDVNLVIHDISERSSTTNFIHYDLKKEIIKYYSWERWCVFHPVVNIAWRGELSLAAEYCRHLTESVRYARIFKHGEHLLMFSLWWSGWNYTVFIHCMMIILPPSTTSKKYSSNKLFFYIHET